MAIYNPINVRILTTLSQKRVTHIHILHSSDGYSIASSIECCKVYRNQVNMNTLINVTKYVDIHVHMEEQNESVHAKTLLINLLRNFFLRSFENSLKTSQNNLMVG